MEDIFAWRGEFYNETYARANQFIGPLLKSFCLASKITIAPADHIGVGRYSFMMDLLRFCLTSKKYKELEVLLQECYCPMVQTTAITPTRVFQLWNGIGGIQVEIAGLHVPGDDLYWEDSRMCMKTWDSVIMRRILPDGRMSRQPMPITVLPDGIKFCDEEQERQLKDSDIVTVLERKREVNDWKILLACESQGHSASAIAIANTPGPHKIWVFPQDIVQRRDSTARVS